MKKRFGWLTATVMGMSLTVWAGSTVVVAPARFNVIQVGMDLAARHDVTLVSYQGEASTAKPLLHIWNGQEWNFVTLEDFQAGKFLTEKPKQTLVIGDEQMVPQALAPMSSWAGRQQTIPIIETQAMLNQVGTALKFHSADWEWFAARYNLKLQDLNAPQRKISVYDQKLGDPFTLKRRDTGPKATIVQPSELAPATVKTVEPKPVADEPSVLNALPTEKPADQPAATTPAAQ